MKNRLTERDLSRIVKRVINEENEEYWKDYGFDDEESYSKDYISADEYAEDLTSQIYDEVFSQIMSFLDLSDIQGFIKNSQEEFINKYGAYVKDHESTYNENISGLLKMNANFDSESAAGAMTEALFGNIENFGR